MIKRLVRMYWWVKRRIMTYQWCRDYEVSLNRRVDVSNVLGSVASGKRDLLTREECKELAAKLEVPVEWIEKREKKKAKKTT